MEVLVEDWNILEKTDLDWSGDKIKLKGWYLSRKQSNADSFVWLKINSNSPFEKVKSSRIAVQSNARFVEVYYVQDTMVEYLTTLRGAVGSDKYVFEIEHSAPLQFNQLHLKFLSIKNHSVDQTPGNLELKIKKIEVTLSQSAYEAANTRFIGRNSGNGVRSDSNGSQNSENSNTTTETRIEGSPASNQGVNDNPSVSSTSDSHSSSNSQSQTNGSDQRMDVRQMILMGMNKPAPMPSINLNSSPQSNDMLIQLMLQMKSSLLSDISGLLDSKLLPIANRLDKLESSISELKNKMKDGAEASN